MNNLDEILNLDKGVRKVQVKKGAILQSAGELVYRGFYVEKGLLRSYFLDDNGKEHVFMFAPEGWLIADMEFLEFQNPAKLYIEALENSEIKVIEESSFAMANLSKEQLIENNKLLSRRIGMMQQRLILMMSAPAVKRYQNFLDTYPELPNRVPQRMIASYLGITPQALSTIRGTLARSG